MGACGARNLPTPVVPSLPRVTCEGPPTGGCSQLPRASPEAYRFGIPGIPHGHCRPGMPCGAMIHRQGSSGQLGRRLTAAAQYRATRAALSKPWHQSSSHSRSSGHAWPIGVRALRARRAGPGASSRRGVLDRERVRRGASAAMAFAGSGPTRPWVPCLQTSVRF